MKQLDNLNIKQLFKEIDFVTVQQNIAIELEALKKLRINFSRNTLNIGVVGRARQGKSRLLQSLTGLSANEIPDGNRGFCTGVKSKIYHTPNVETYAPVWFHTEQSFLEEVIFPYYDKLNLSSKPSTLEEFASSTLPGLPEYMRSTSSLVMYDYLRQNYYLNLPMYREMLQVQSPQLIEKSQIREYLSQENVTGERTYFNYLAVREVHIYSDFPNAYIGQIALVDMPGLGDARLGDEEKLIKSLAEDIDIILFVRRPSPFGDYWTSADVALYDLFHGLMSDLPQRSFMILNRTNIDSADSDNLQICQYFQSQLEEMHIKVVECIIANCADSQEVNTQIIEQVIKYLTTNITSLNRQDVSSHQLRLFQLQSTITADLNKAHQALLQVPQFQNIQKWQQLIEQAVTVSQLRNMQFLD
ncbi:MULTISPECIES: hypothetical protein [unclassified Tolypothrix]|nr:MULTISPECIES: hypothetical protein [unclassified Tolypothrix]MBE9082930.1 hypothetical protein [Tolypothrix sp. LEGE 11397]UYD33712.1 hypothetical protein HG267_33280 [Tolypothrix sp. PCC 7601]BAY89803.1 hypothetical protein NIES3275_18060 [Microchaete diplosiphon NIES-3275]